MSRWLLDDKHTFRATLVVGKTAYDLWRLQPDIDRYQLHALDAGCHTAVHLISQSSSSRETGTP